MPQLRRRQRGTSSLAMLMIVLFLLSACDSTDHAIGSDNDEWDPHREWMDRFLTSPAPALLKEVLIVGDGARMRFWPLWDFYRYLNASLPVADSPDPAACGAGPRVRLITPDTPGFLRGMLASDAVERFATTAEPILYFLTSPGDEPLLLRGVRHHPGPRVLEIEDMEGTRRLTDLILRNRITTVVHRYFGLELHELQEACPATSFMHLPFFLDPAHFPEHAAPPSARPTDVLVYGSTWSHRYPLRHRVLRALTTRPHNLSFAVLPHPGYAHADAPLEDAHASSILCSAVPAAFWSAALPDPAVAAGGRGAWRGAAPWYRAAAGLWELGPGGDGARGAPACCGAASCGVAHCRAAALAVAHGPLASCDDALTCRAFEPAASVLAARRALAPCVGEVRGSELGARIRESKVRPRPLRATLWALRRADAMGAAMGAAPRQLAVSCAIEGAALYGHTLSHGYLVAKFHGRRPPRCPYTPAPPRPRAALFSRSPRNARGSSCVGALILCWRPDLVLAP
jgi:hypothetical protein